jgi:ABC-type Zn2+ transport system substrate-binding protein/surface adhesin
MAREAAEDAAEMVKNFLDEIVEQLTNEGEASTDLLNDYPEGDAYHFENHVDRDYDLEEAAEILNEYHEYEETDTGLWLGQEPRRAIATQAAYTYGNAVYAKAVEIVRSINEQYADWLKGQVGDFVSHVADEYAK